MTPIIAAPGIKNPVSRISIASLQDLGYTIDYSKADRFGSQDLNPACSCGVIRRSLVGTRQLVYNDSQLSEELYQQAVDYGNVILTESAELYSQYVASQPIGEGNELVEYVGDKVISIVVQDGDAVFSVVVVRDV